MLEYSVRVYEKLIRQSVSDVTKEEIDQIVYAHDYYSDENPLYYPDFWDIIAYYNSNLPKENIDQIFVNAVERTLSAENPLDAAVRSLYINPEEEDDESIIDRRRQLTRCYNMFIRCIRNPHTLIDFDEDDVSSLISKGDYDEMLDKPCPMFPKKSYIVSHTLTPQTIHFIIQNFGRKLGGMDSLSPLWTPINFL